MSPTESQILSTFLLTPSPLPQILTLSQFTSLFPRAQQTSPLIKQLYRDLQHQRSRQIDRVTREIEGECKRGERERREVVRRRREGEGERSGRGGGEVDEEGEVEEVMYNGQTSNLPITKLHTLRSILPELEKAAEDVEEEIRKEEEEADALLAEMQNVIGGLSDLRYGRLANGELREQVLDGLARLERSCDDGK